MKTNKKYMLLSLATVFAVAGMTLGASSFAQTALTCSPAVQNVTLGQTASVSASGGTGAYVWSAPGLTIANPTGAGFSANYASTGLKTLTVTSGSASATCQVNVLSAPAPAPVPPVTPGLPDTGGGYGK